MVVAGVLAGILMRGGAPPPFAASGIQWMTPAFWSLLACSAAAVTIPLQYFRRATTRARQIVGGAVLVAPMLSLSTWDSAFAVQRRLSPNPTVAEPIAIAFDSSLGRSAAEPASTSATAVLLPLRVSGLAPEAIVMNDRADVRLMAVMARRSFAGERASISVTPTTFLCERGKEEWFALISESCFRVGSMSLSALRSSAWRSTILSRSFTSKPCHCGDEW